MDGFPHTAETLPGTVEALLTTVEAFPEPMNTLLDIRQKPLRIENAFADSRITPRSLRGRRPRTLAL